MTVLQHTDQELTFYYTWVTWNNMLMEVLHLYQGYIIGAYPDGSVHVLPASDIWNQLEQMKQHLDMDEDTISPEQQQLFHDMIHRYKQKGRA